MESNQEANPRTNHVTTSQGFPVSGNQDSITLGPSGPILLQDFHLIDKLAKFDRERIPERVVHAKGAGAHGFFEVTHDISKYCKAKVFSKIGKMTPIFTRFSTVGGEKGSADTERDPRGFAVKFYTEEGNWDMVGNNTPIFFIRDPIKFPDFIHTQKRDPQTNCKDANMMWDFWSLHPESVHQVTFLFSDRGTPDGYRKMNGYASHTYRWNNEAGECFYVKMHFKTNQGIHNHESHQADQLKSSDADYATRDLFDSIKKGDFPSWDFKIQVMPVADAKKYRVNVYDVTKVWPHSDYPLIPVGRIVLNRNPENYFAEVEQVAFAPAHMVPGMQASYDKMLQGRLFSYPDTQRHRLGANYDQIPINCPYRTRVNNGQRDGPMVVNGNQGSNPNYEPNTTKPYTINPRAQEVYEPISGVVKRHGPVIKQVDDFLQPGNLFRNILNEQQRTNLINNIVGSLSGASRPVQLRQVALFTKCDPEYGARVAQGLGLPTRKPKL